jgi:hypothetical protein
MPAGAAIEVAWLETYAAQLDRIQAITVIWKGHYT